MMGASVPAGRREPGVRAAVAVAALETAPVLPAPAANPVAS